MSSSSSVDEEQEEDEDMLLACVNFMLETKWGGKDILQS